MGFRIRKRRTQSEKAGALVVTLTSNSSSIGRRRRNSTSNAATPIVIATESPADEVLVRATSICNSENLDRLHRQMRESGSPCVATSSSRRVHPEDPWSEANLREAIELWKLNDDEVARLKELQHNLKDCAHHFKYDPHIVLRFMTSPLGKDAEPLFRKMVQWRIENKIDSFLDDYKPDPILVDYNTTAILKDYDYDGDPIYVERGGMTDGYGMLKRFSKEQLMDYAIYTRELNTQGAWISDYEQRQGHKVKDVTVVYDLKGMNTHHLNPQVLNFFGQIMALNSEKYPGPLKRMIIIRAPALFRFAWTIVKNFFPQSSRDKMVFAGKHPEKILAKYMDLKVLPACICEGGEGEVAIGLPPKIEGGVIPEHRQPLHYNNTRAFHSQDTFDVETEHDSIVSSADTSMISAM